MNRHQFDVQRSMFDVQRSLSRRQLLSGTRGCLGAAALASLMGTSASGKDAEKRKSVGGLPELPHFVGKAKRVIYLFMAGGPSHIDLFDYKPALRKIHGQELPESIRKGQRLTTMTSGQTSFPCVAPMFEFKKHGQHGTYVSEILPHTAGIVDDLTIVKSVNTEAINHDPAITFFQTGSPIPGRPSIGSWMTYGLGSENENLPGFVAMTSRGSAKNGQPLYDRLWGSGFLPAKYQGVKFRGQGDPVLDINNPPGIDGETRRKMLDVVSKLNRIKHAESADPEIQTRIAQYELAYRMQTSVPELSDLSDEPESTFERYGPDSRKPGSFARNCLLARRLAERDVRFIQLFHRGWDQHGNLPKDLRRNCDSVDQPAAALVKDLKQRGMLDDTLVIWTGEFGRTPFAQGGNGRDHNPFGFTTWMAGGGIKGGTVYGATDEWGYKAIQNKVEIHDLHATMLHLLGLDHKKLVYRYGGRDFRLTNIHGNVVHDIIA